ncbi:MAG: hypothetical protein PUP91_09140 [Rhizonema sp. PD37]|nr:hypothetical protein [Rhizonema sp. PD37]
MITKTVAEDMVVLCVEYTTFLDYDSILLKLESYSPIGNGVYGLT